MPFETENHHVGIYNYKKIENQTIYKDIHHNMICNNTK